MQTKPDTRPAPAPARAPAGSGATLARFFVVSALTKYQLGNRTNDRTILDGFARVWTGFPMFLGICSIGLGIVYHSFLFPGAGTALYVLFGKFEVDWVDRAHVSHAHPF